MLRFASHRGTDSSRFASRRQSLHQRLAVFLRTTGIHLVPLAQQPIESIVRHDVPIATVCEIVHGLSPAGRVSNDRSISNPLMS